MLFLSATNLLERGLSFLHFFADRWTPARKTLVFKKHYGASPLDLASQWYDLQVTTITDAQLSEHEKSVRGLRHFLAAHFFLWSYPKNAELTASLFNICVQYAHGKMMWLWVSRIAALKAMKVKWIPSLDDTNKETFILSVDGTDFRIWEPKHPTLPIDKGMMSHKFKHAALKYEIAISVQQSKVCFFSGPYRGGEHDLEIFRKALKNKIKDGKKVIADGGYATSRTDERMLSLPNPLDSRQLKNFKSRSRLRLETFNGRLKKYEVLNQTFRHGIEKHRLAFEAVLVTCQYVMENGSELFDV